MDKAAFIVRRSQQNIQSIRNIRHIWIVLIAGLCTFIKGIN